MGSAVPTTTSWHTPDMHLFNLCTLQFHVYTLPDSNKSAAFDCKDGGWNSTTESQNVFQIHCTAQEQNAKFRYTNIGYLAHPWYTSFQFGWHRILTPHKFHASLSQRPNSFLEGHSTTKRSMYTPSSPTTEIVDTTCNSLAYLHPVPPISRPPIVQFSFITTPHSNFKHIKRSGDPLFSFSVSDVRIMI